MPGSPPRIFLLSPARLDGKRAHLLFHPVTMFPVARALHSRAGAPIGEIFTFLSGLYFRGKLAYASAFARPPHGISSGVFVITANRGLLAPSVRVTVDDLADLAKTDIDPYAEEFRKPLRQDAEALAEALGPRGEPVLLGSIATTKYSDVLLSAFTAGASFSGGVRRSRRHEPWRSLASLSGCAPGTGLRAGERSCSARRSARQVASSIDSILSLAFRFCRLGGRLRKSLAYASVLSAAGVSKTAGSVLATTLALARLGAGSSIRITYDSVRPAMKGP